MLILSRKQGEAIAIESDIEIEVLQIKKGRVRLGIRAPRTRKILRSEIADAEIDGQPPLQRYIDAELRSTTTVKDSASVAPNVPR